MNIFCCVARIRRRPGAVHRPELDATPASASAEATWNHERGLAEDSQVPAQRSVGDVIEVEADHLFVVQFAPPADLPRPSQAGEYLETTCVAMRIQVPQPIAIAKLQGARSDQAHLPFENVD